MTSLDLRIKRPLRTHPDTEWPEWISEGRTIKKMIDTSGLLDKSIAVETGIDPAVLSKAQSGTARLNEQQMDALMDACGSEAWLDYWLLKRGYDPRQKHRMKSDIELENEALRDRLKELEREHAIEVRLFKELRGT